MNSELNPEHQNMVDNYINGVNNKNINHYMLTIARDGESPVRSILFFTSAIEAAEAYNMYSDWGFAKEYLTVKLYEPTGKINEKILKRNQAGDPTFLRQNYIDVASVLNDLKPLLQQEVYESSCIKIMESFAKDNWRFNPERFLNILGINKTLKS
jgi:hypothetical protein